jgi:hypothetical protein
LIPCSLTDGLISHLLDTAPFVGTWKAATCAAAPSFEALLLYFRHDIARIVLAWLTSITAPASPKRSRRPHGLADHHRNPTHRRVGLAFKDAIEGSLRNLG